jgi:alpha-galactosidase
MMNIRANGQDQMPALLRIAAERVAEAAAQRQRGDTSTGQNPYSSPTGDAFSWQLLQHFGAFPAPMDRHVTEFFPQFYREGQYFGRTLGVDVFSFEGTIADGDRGYATMQAHACGPEPLPANYFDQFGGEHEQVIDIIAAVRQDQNLLVSANLPNTGQAPNLPAGAVIESPALVNGEGLRPLALAPLPPALAGTLATRFQWVETVVEAALENSREKFIQALVLDGAVHSLEQAAALADELLEAQAAYL